MGSASFSFSQRWSQHLSDLRKGKHGNRHLQHAWNKYGASAFEISILMRCPADRCLALEQSFINGLGVLDDNVGYNISPTAGSRLGTKLGYVRKQTPEERARKAIYMLGHPVSDEARANMRRAALAAYERKRAEFGRIAGRTPSEETRAKMSMAAKERLKRTPLSKEGLAAMLAGNRIKYSTEKRPKKVISDETRAKMSAFQKLRWATRPHVHTEATRVKLRAAAALRLSQPNERERLATMGELGRQSRWNNKNHECH